MSSNVAKAAKKRKKEFKVKDKLFFWRKAKENKRDSSVAEEEENSLIDVNNDESASSVDSHRDTAQTDVHETTDPVHAPDFREDVLSSDQESSKKLAKLPNDSGGASAPKEASRQPELMFPPINRSNRSDVGSEKVKSAEPKAKSPELKVESNDPKVKLPDVKMQSTAPKVKSSETLMQLADPKVESTDSKTESPEPIATDDADGLKKKETKDSQSSKKKINANERENRQSFEESGISVRFHALLPSVWGFDQSNKHHRVWIRFGAKELGDWKINYADMKVVGEIKHKGETYLKLCGSHSVPLVLKSRPIPYKYVFVKWDDSGQKDRYEYVAKGSHSGNVNRVLEIPFSCEGVLDKYDDAIHPEQGAWESIKDTFKFAFGSSSTAQADGREAAILSMIPKWKGFHCDGKCDQMSAKEAVSSFISIVRSLVDLRVLEDKPRCFAYSFAPSGFKKEKIVAQILKRKIHDFRTISLLNTEVAEDRVLSAVAISVLIKEFKVESYMEVEYLETLSMNLYLTPDATNETCPSYQAVLENFSDPKGRVREAVTAVCRLVCRKQHVPRAHWLLAMPLLHFLSDLVSPFDPPRQSDHTVSSWWMLCGLRPEIDNYRSNSVTGLLSKDKNVLDPLLRLDPSLGRVILVSHKSDDLKEWVSQIHPCETIRSLEKRLSTPKLDRLPAAFLENSLVQLASLVSATNVDSDLRVVYSLAKRETSGSVDLLSVLRTNFGKKEHTSLLRASVDLVFVCVKLLKQLQFMEPELSSKDGKKPFCEEQLALAARSVCEWIRLAFSSFNRSDAQIIHNEIKVWNFMLDCASLPQDLQEVWGECFKAKLTEKLEKAKEEEVIKVYCDLDESETHAIIKDSFTDVSELAMKNLLSHNGDQASAFASLLKSVKNPGGKGAHSRRLLKMMIKNKCPPLDASDEVVFHSLLTWPVWIHFLGIPDDVLAEGDEDFSRPLARGKKVLSDYVERVVSSAVTVKQFRFIMEHKRKFLELCHETDRAGFRAKADRAIADRNKELNTFEEKKRKVNNFVGACMGHGNVSFEWLNYGQDVSDLCISDLAVTQDGGSINVVYFNLPDDVDHFIEPLDKVKESIVFQQIWIRLGDCLRESRKRSENTETVLNVREIISKVVQPAFAEWDVWCQSVVDGSITLEDVLTLFRSIIDEEGHLKKELCLMQKRALGKEDVDVVLERVTQITQFTALNEVSNSARAIERVRCALGILESFPSIQKILSQSSSDYYKQPLTVISSDVVSASRFLSERRRCEIECLNQFADCDMLIKWIREEIGEWKELETFVELAETRSSAEGDYEAMKVAHLRAACVGFSAFLFDIGKSASLSDLQKACMTVFKKLERDKKIPDKWQSSQDCLREFEAIKKSLGSVEITSFSMVEAINSRGKYTVECQSETDSPHDISDCIYLDISSAEDGDKAERKRRSLSDLQDLQSKLILISGHNSERRNEVNVFVDTLESVMRLATNLLALCRSGHVGYLTWTCWFDCVSPLDYADDTDGDSPTKRIEKLLEKMRGVASKMERDLKNWKQKMASLRSQYYYLNYFTTSQLLILSKELGSVARDKSRSSESLPAHVYALLDGIKPNVSADEVASCLQNEQEEEAKEDSHQLSSLQQFSEQSFRSVFDAGFSSTFGEDCWDASAETSAVDSLFQNDEPISSSPSEHSFSATETMFDLENESYLSFSSLGKFLEQLSQKATRPPLRAFPSTHLKLGYPNLAVVPRAELLASVLRFYMSDTGSETSLPSAEEVLLCASTTTVEDVCLFWRRAIKDPSQRRLFCLVGADQLSYEVSREAVDELSRLGQGLANERGDKYRLVVICSAENADKSYMVSALDQHRWHPLPTPTAAEIEQYLKKQFQKGPAGLRLRTALNTMWTPAAQKLDSEQSCVRVVYSTRAGVGKSLFIDRMAENLAAIPNNRGGESLRITIPVHEISVNVDVVLESLKQSFPSPRQSLSRLIHLDISPSVKFGLDHFLFNLLVLGQVTDSIGHVWRRRFTDMYVLECTWPAGDKSSEDARLKRFEQLLPNAYQNSPSEILADLNEGRKSEREIEFSRLGSEHFQRAFEYLRRLTAGNDLTKFKFSPEEFTGEKERQIPSRLETILKNCGVPNPSWAVVRHFVTFFGSQMRDAELNAFCGPLCYQDLPGFKNFVLKLLIEMSRDFSTPSLDVDLSKIEDPGNLAQYRVRRSWEHTPHPYLFFNEDRHTITFIGLQITRDGHLIDSRREKGRETGKVLQSQIMTPVLSTALYTQGFRLQQDYENWSKIEKIAALCNVMGLKKKEFDPDLSYELTMDNLTKIMAIHMRFRCGIPVVIMGETGCGKTRLIRYMCALQAQKKGCKNMLLMKVHGGVTRKDVIDKVKVAEKQAQRNSRENVKTVLFFDEANTTDAVGLIKEIMCDGRVNGRSIAGLGTNLHVIAACNPYRKHTDVMIEKLDSAGLGYHVRTGDTEDRLGDIPLRQLVYRVHPLPDSMKALVWDFGQLDPKAERLYIRQIVSRHVEVDETLPNVSGFIDVVTNILAACQAFMRHRDDECSFVSLRDVERAMRIMVWFYKLRDVLDKCVEDQYKERHVNSDTSKPLDSLTRSLVLSLGVSYYARLEKRRDFLREISGHFRAPCRLLEGQTQISEEIEYCQTAFLNELELPPKIGRNHALKENVFMMVVCIDLRIPLFLVGKPGSSKSLAKDVVKNAMRGDLSNRKLFKRLKQVHMVSYQCSPLSTADGIISTFNQCQKMQRENDLDKFVACVVLDEVGLAEDSPRLPLKALHPLLDDGTAGADDDVEKDSDSNRVAFVGISNWALDPAKMNRGILVQREVPTDDELVVSAEGICSTDRRAHANLKPHVVGMAKAYLKIYNRPKADEICNRTKKDEKEFFGLRDFYSLVKMMFSFCKKTGEPPTWNQFEHAIKRNFGGLETVDCVGIFQDCISLQSIRGSEISTDSGENDDTFKSLDDEFDFSVIRDDGDRKESSLSSPPLLDSSPTGLIRANLGTADHSDEDEESRYLLLLTENYAALNILRQKFLVNDQPVIIFGSSFSKDQEYTQICRNINRIKVCMATGRTVVLLNLENLYESLYDALNQYYVRHGGQKFVDLGLGSHRVKCQVHDKFRLILIADREVVYNDYPIPLINRMEKHFLAMSSILTDQEQGLVERISEWVKQFADVNSPLQVIENRKRILFRVEDAFIGYHPDAVATVVLRVCRRLLSQGDHPDETQMLSAAYEAMLQCATPDAVARLSTSAIREQASDLWDVYFKGQNHSSLADFVESALDSCPSESGLLIQVTTHSRLLSSDDVAEVEKRIAFSADCVSLQQFDTEHQFATRIREFYALRPKNKALLIILCESGDVNGDLVACARYVVQEERQDAETRIEAMRSPLRKHVVFVIHLPRIAGKCFVGFQGGSWTETHIDDLRPANQAKEPSITSLEGRKISELLDDGEETNVVKNEREVSLEKESGLLYGAEVAETFAEPDDVEAKDAEGPPDENEADWQTMQAMGDTEELVVSENETKGKDDEKTGKEERAEADKEEERDSNIIKGEENVEESESRIDKAEEVLEEEEEVEDITQTQMAGDREEDEEDDDADDERSRSRTYSTKEKENEEKEEDSKFSEEEKGGEEDEIDTSSERRGDAVLSGAILLRSCVHGATSRLDDDEASASFEFANRRLKSLLVLIPENETCVVGNRSFYYEIRRRIVELLREREERMGEEKARGWVKNEALNPSGIQAGGTFRHSLWLKIVNIVTPIFSEIIASIDVDANLSLLTDSTEKWVSKLWMKIFSNRQLLHLCYEDFISPREHQPRQRICIHGSGYQGHSFRAQFPFSKLAKEKVDGMMTEANRLKGNERLDRTLKRLFDDSPLGVLIKKTASNPKERKELTERYLSDFVHMVYNPINDEDFQMMNEAVVSSFIEMTSAGDADSVERALSSNELSIPAVHAAYDHVQSRMTCFAELIRLHPDVVRQVYHQKGPETSNEMNLDAFAFRDYLEKISPKKNDIVYANARREWLERVQEARPCIERWLALPFDSNVLQQRAKLHSTIQKMWIKVSVVRLFFYHTSSADEKGVGSFVEEAGLNLLTAFNNMDPNFASESPIRVVLEILNEASQRCSDNSTGTICSQCGSNWTDPIQLPCRHVFCSRCVKNRIKNESRLSCPSCEEEVPDDFNPEATSQVLISAFSSLRTGCTSFFMDLVSAYSFSETASNPPQRDLIGLLMSLVTGGEKSVTRAFSPFHVDAVDRTPVVRSFILQLLLRLHSKESMNYIQEYFTDAERALVTCDEESHIETSGQNEHELLVIFVQCVEDSIARGAHRERDFLGAVIWQIRFCLTNFRDENPLHYLQAVAAARFVFSTLANCIFRVLNEPRSLNRQIECLFAQARELCTTWNDSHLHFFLLKQLVRQKGIEVLAKLRNVYGLEWLENLVPPTADHGNVIPDYCVVIGPSYQTVREAVARAALTGNFTDLNDTIQALSHDVKTTSRTAFLLLAVYREVTMRRASMDCDSPSSERIRSSLKELFCDSGTLPSWAEPIATQLIENTLGGDWAPGALVVKPDQPLQTRAVAAVAVHARIALESSVSTGNELMTSLRRLFREPDRFIDSYLPTMPEDNFLAVKGVTKEGEGTKWLECSNGHPFFIDNCGRPMEREKSHCVICGAQIGDKKSILAPKSSVAINRNITDKGYLLESPSARPDDSLPERNLSSAGCALVRLLVDAALMWASCVEKPRSIRKMIKSKVPDEVDLPSFFWDHLEKDVLNFSRAISQAPEDASAVIHQILCSLDKPQSVKNVALGSGFFLKRSERSAWENEFSQKCVDPVLHTLDTKMSQWMHDVVEDGRVGNNPLMRWLYELEPPPEGQSPPTLWRYRSKVTLQHLSLSLSQRFVGKKTDDQPRILMSFLEQEPRLRVLRSLPEVLRLQRLLRNKFHRRLAVHEAETVTIETFLQRLTDVREREDFNHLIGLFTRVWQLLRAEILSHGRLKPRSPEDRLEKVTQTTPIAFLLPTTQGRGTCAMSLVDYLINCVHNEFVATFRRLAGIERSIAKVPMAEVTRAHLISYDFEKDLLPLVLAHCRYSLEVGRGTDITYDYKALERQLIDRFLLGKPHIDFKVHEFVFSKSFYSTALFTRIERNIPQENLDNVVSRQILDELHDLTDIFNVLSVLDVLIGFAVSIGGERDAMIHEYLHDALKMPKDRGLISQKAQQCCRLKHILSLWRLLTVEKGRRFVRQRQDPFDQDLPQRFKEEMNDDLKFKFKVFIKKVKINHFLEDLMTLALLELKHRDDVRELEDYTLKDALEEMYHSQLPGLSELPAGVKLRHLVDCWSTGVLCQDHH